MRVRRVAKTLIGGLNGKEECTGMQPCKRADASCRRRAIGPFKAWADHPFFLLFVVTGVDNRIIIEGNSQ